MEINKNGIIYYFTKEKNEINDMFYERCRHTLETEKKILTEKEFDNAIKQSKLNIYTKYYKCFYNTT